MPDTYTPNLNLVLPEVGSSRDTWGSKLNSNTTILDQFVFLSTPIGALLDFAGPNAPPGWLIADGRAVSRTTYSALFAAIGVYWGAGDGVSTFNLPASNGRAAIGPGTVIDTNGTSITYSFTQKTGAVTNAIAQVHLPNITLTSNTTGSHSHGGATVNAGPWTVGTTSDGNHSHGAFTGLETANHTHSGATDTQGDHAHTVNAWGAVGGAALVAAGGIATGNSIATSTNGAHAHNFTTGNMSASHQHAIGADGNHAHNVTVTAHAHGITADGNHAHNIALGGSGTLFPVLQPVLVVTKIIYAGNQAAVVVMGEIVPAAMASELAITDELATLRTELAELRAILMPPRSLRVMSSPSRGPH